MVFARKKIKFKIQYLFLNQSNSSKHEIVIWFFKFILDVFEFAKLQKFCEMNLENGSFKPSNSVNLVKSCLLNYFLLLASSASKYIRRPGEHRH